MARSEEDLANAALGYLVRDTIRSLDGTTPAAVQTKANMSMAIEEVISDYDWPECRVIGALSLVSGVDPRGYSYVYAEPSDMVKLWGIGDNTVQTDSPVLYERGMSADISSDRSYIFTNQAGAYARYGSNRIAVGRFTAAVFGLIALKLAAKCCMVLTKDLKLHKYLLDTYKLDLSKVITSVANAEPEMTEIDFIPESIAARSA